MIVDLHNHTPLCNHASGEPREFVEKAIEKKIDIYGFSDHAPIAGGFDSKYRMDFAQMERYEKTVKELKKEFSAKIEILLGYEVDYIPNRIDQRVLKSDTDYLIGSVHFLSLKNKKDLWGFDNPEFIGEYKNRDIDDIWQEYFSCIENMAKSSLFNIVGHLDLIKVFGFKPKKDIKTAVEKALKAIKKAGMAIEISGAGLRKPIKEIYPSKEILEMAYGMDIPVTFASDAHSVEQVGYGLKECIELAKEIGYEKCAVFREREMELIKF